MPSNARVTRELTNEEWEALADVFYRKAMLFVPYRQHWWRRATPIFNEQVIRDLIIQVILDTALTDTGERGTISVDEWSNPESGRVGKSSWPDYGNGVS